MLARQIRRLRPGRGLLQHTDDLTFREPCSLHLSVLQEGRTLNPRGRKSQRQVTSRRLILGAVADAFGHVVQLRLSVMTLMRPAMITIIPPTISVIFGLTLEIVRALPIKLYKIAPRQAPRSVPEPPKRLTPPMTAAAIDSRLRPVPPIGLLDIMREV